MLWVLILQIGIAYTCITGIQCPEPTQQRRILGKYQTLDACERARKQRHHAFNQPVNVHIPGGVDQSIITAMMCEQGEE
jgi:hypothetical protein